LTLDPTVTTPDGDGIADFTTVTYTLSGRAAVTATIADAASGLVVATLFSQQLQGARTQSFPYRPDELPDGAYVLSITAVGEDGRTEQQQAGFAVDRTLTALMLNPSVVTPNGDGADDALTIGFTLGAPADVTVQIEQAGVVVAQVFTGPLQAGLQQFSWDGNAPAGPAPSGAYDLAIVARGPLGETRHRAAFTIQR
jgi:hypothetical protein